MGKALEDGNCWSFFPARLESASEEEKYKHDTNGLPLFAVLLVSGQRPLGIQAPHFRSISAGQMSRVVSLISCP